MNILSVSFVIAASIVISEKLIMEAIPVGSPREHVEEYLEEIADKYAFYTRENEPIVSPQYPWIDSEVGYYAAAISNVKSRWWMPSFGSWISIRAGIDGSGKVTQVVVLEGKWGWP